MGVYLHCNGISVQVADRWWWSVGDAQRTKVAELVPFRDGTEPPLCN